MIRIHLISLCALVYVASDRFLGGVANTQLAWGIYACLAIGAVVVLARAWDAIEDRLSYRRWRRSSAAARTRVAKG